MDRKHQFKHKTATAKSIREKRRQDRHEERKKKRDDALKGKRIRQNTAGTEEDEFTEEQVAEITKKLLEGSESRIENLKSVRRALSFGSALIEAFLNVDGALNCLVDIMNNGEGDEKTEAAWCLNNISAGTDSQARAVIDVAGDALIKGLTSVNIPLEDQCSWAIGNLAGGSVECRDLLRSKGAIEPLINLLMSPTANVVHCAAFALSNLARDKETTNLLTDAGILTHLASLLVYDKNKEEILSEVSWVLTYLTACGTHEKKVLEAGILEKIINLLIEFVEKNDDNVQVLTPLLRCLGNIICSGLEETKAEACLQKELFPALDKLIHSDHQHVRKECVWVLSNITALPSACQELIGADLVSSIINLLSATYDIKKEAVYTMCNIAANGGNSFKILLEKGALKAVVPLLKSHDVDTVHYALSFTEMMLHVDENSVKTFVDCGGLDGLETLEYNNNDLLREQADKILDTYFYKEDLVESNGGDQVEETNKSDDQDPPSCPSTGD